MSTVINTVSNSLEAMGVQQYLMAFLFLGCYSMALSQFSGARGRAYATAGALASAVCFIALSTPWESGVLVVAFGLITVGGLAAAVWGIWAMLGWAHARHGSHARTRTAQSRDDALSTVAAALDVLARPRKLARAGDTQR
jgi:hypothetical protein